MKFFIPLFFVGCMSTQGVDEVTEEKVREVLKKNPELVIGVIEKEPEKFVEAFQKALKKAEKSMAKKRREDEKKKLEEAFENPLKPLVRPDEAIRGNKGGQIVLVEYSDFECPYCKKGYETVMKLMKRFPKDIKFVYKHLPLSFHQNAMEASRYYEAIRLESEEKAFKFHDLIFEDQRRLRNGEKFLKEVAKKAGADPAKLKKNLKSEKVQERIDQDMEEASKFGMQGTPGFIINGVPVRGAYPESHFIDILKKLKKKGKISIDI